MIRWPEYLREPSHTEVPLTTYLARGLYSVPAAARLIGTKPPIIVDPRISFGAPVIEGTRIETAVIADLYQGEDSNKEIAWLYDLEPIQINAAVAFEASLVA